VIGSDCVIKQAQPSQIPSEAFAVLIAIPREFQQELAIVTAVGDMKDSTIDRQTTCPPHGQRL